ncbi:MAG: DUF3363 domain-containing protein, partial [Bradyrhizobium sp.]|nr:DUF3363 domain-containing protein [Bradyrhizobium sp.]
LAVRSDLSLDQQVVAEGATWLDRRLVAREGAELSRAGFGAEVRAALDRRIDILAEQGLVRRDGDKVTIGRNLVATLRSRELDVIGRRLASETGLSHLPAEAGETVTGVYRQRLSLASGRFAMIDNGLGFQLVPWTPSLERELGRHVNGIAGPGGVEWSLGRKRDLAV